jgi:hypothetical protein
VPPFWSRIVDTIFPQVNYIIQLVKPVIEGKVASFEVTASAADAYNIKIQTRMSRSVWLNCNSWYRVGRTGKVFSLFPGETPIPNVLILSHI